MTPELWGIVIAAIVGLIGAVTLALKSWLPKYLEAWRQKQIESYRAEIEAEAYERNRTAFREDKFFDGMENTLEWLKQERENDREESRQERELQHNLIATVDKLANHIGRLTDIQRILAQNAAKIDDRLAHLEAVIQQANRGWLGGSND